MGNTVLDDSGKAGSQVGASRDKDDDSAEDEHSDHSRSSTESDFSRTATEDQRGASLLPPKSESSSWTMTMIERMALFGSSGGALALSFFVLLCSVAASWYLDASGSVSTVSPVQQAPSLGPIPKVGPPMIFKLKIPSDDSDQPSLALVTRSMRISYQNDGVIAVRGLIPPELLDRLDQASSDLVDRKKQSNRDQPKPRGPLTGMKKTGRQFHTVKSGVIFQGLDTNNNSNTENDIDESNEDNSIASGKQSSIEGLPPFIQTALFSNVPRLAAELLHIHNPNVEKSKSNSTMRVLRDVFLAKDKERYICGWHVDDTGFWPADADAPGVNAWIALDDMPVGGFALAVGSHRATWRQDAYRVTGATPTLPKEGYRSVSDMFQNRTGSGTCNMEQSAPHLHQRMEDTKRVYDIKRGDVIFHNRWLFHRTVALDHDAVDKDFISSYILRRYSIRYGPGWSRIPRGYGTEPSVLWDERNGGRSADEVVALDGAWYPRAWPSADLDEVKSMVSLKKNRFDVVEERQRQRRAEMKPYLQSIGRNQH